MVNGPKASLAVSIRGSRVFPITTCRISLVEDSDGKLWLEMLNLDMIINAYPLPPELQAIAITINGTMLSILTAGATGAF